MIKTYIQKLLYPGIILINYLLFSLFYTSNNSYLVVPVLLLFSFSVIRFAEILMPKIEEWNNVSSELITDLLHILISKIGTKEVANLLLYGSLLKFQNSLKAYFDISEFTFLKNTVFQLILAILIAEFLSYWIHRKSHEFRTLWKLHSIHHSPKRMWIFNVSRAHPFDILFRLVTPFAILVIIGFDEKVLGAYLVVTSTIAFLQHSNLELKTKGFNSFLVTPTVHHWHHSMQKNNSCNFGHIVIIYDRLFGTFYLPDSKAIECQEVGIIDSDVPENFIEQIKYPFKRE